MVEKSHNFIQMRTKLAETKSSLDYQVYKIPNNVYIYKKITHTVYFFSVIIIFFLL